MSNDKLEELYYKYYSLVKDTAYKVLGDHGCTDDVCQDVFLKLSDEWLEKGFSDEERKRYLRVAAFHKAIDYYNERKERFEFITNDKERILEETEDGSEDSPQYLFLSKILKELRAINEDWFTIIIKSELYHEPAALIAKDMGISPNAVRIRHLRAKTWLKKNFSEEYRRLL